MIIITDTASDITDADAKAMNITVVPLIIGFDEINCSGNTPEDFKRFYTLLEQSAHLPMSSQPSPDTFLQLFAAAKASNEEVLVITLSSALSGTYASANIALQMCEYDNIRIVDSCQASLTEFLVVRYAVQLRDQQLPLDEIVSRLEAFRHRVFLCGVTETLTYLKKGGRIPASLAALGNILNIKPVLELTEGVVTCTGKVRGMNAGRKSLIQKLEAADIDISWPLYFGYGRNTDAAESFRAAILESHPELQTELHPIGPVIGTHIGPDYLMLAFVRAEA